MCDSSSEHSSDAEEKFKPPDIVEMTAKMTNDHLPEMSKTRYEKSYQHLMDWKMSKNAISFSENVLLAYFQDISDKFKSPSLWAKYSMLSTILRIKHKVDIRKYSKLIVFLKRNSEGYQGKKSKTFTPQEINKFLREAPDIVYLSTKIALIFGIMGACGRQELYKLQFKNVQVFESTILVKIYNTKSKTHRSFTITGSYYKLCNQYIDLRPKSCNHPYFFINYRMGKCTTEKVGINKFGNLGKTIANFLNLPNPELYTGHCFRRTSARLLVDAGGDLTTLKLQHRWNSMSVAEDNTDESMPSNTQVSNQILNSIENVNDEFVNIDLPSTSTYIKEDFYNVQVKFEARGLMPPVFTPVNDDQTINYSIIPKYAEFLYNSGIKFVLVGGTTGEHMVLSVTDRKKVIDAWLKAGKPLKLHIQVQVGGAPLGDVLNLARYCQSAGVDSLLTLPELYFKPTDVDGLVSYVELVANAAPDLPVLYYHIPHMTHVTVSMPAFVAAATARIPNFKGIKFTSNDLCEGAQVLRELKHGQEVFLGADTLLAPAALLGIKSAIGTTFNIFPQLAQQILNAVEANDVQKAKALQEKLSKAVEAHTSEGPWVPVMKVGMELVTGIKVGPPLLPQKQISAEQRKRIETKLKALGLC